MSKQSKLDSYEVGYGKPPRSTRFRKGFSGNPRGRPKKAPNFDDELLRESRTLITINENGRRRPISKHAAAIKRMINEAISGNMAALRTYLDLRQIALEKAALLEAAQPRDPGKYNDVKELNEEQLLRIIAGSLEDKEQERKQGPVSNAD